MKGQDIIKMNGKGEIDMTDIIIIGDKNNKIKNKINKILKEKKLNKNFKIKDSDQAKVYKTKKKLGVQHE